MKLLKRVVAALLAVAAIAVLVLLIRLTQTTDGDLHLERIESLQKINALDVALNRAVTVNRVSNLKLAGEDKTTIIANLGDAMDGLIEGPLALRGLSPEIDAAVENFIEVAGDKFVLTFDFDIRYTQVANRLSKTVNAVPLFARNVLAESAENDAIAQLTDVIQAQVMVITVAAKADEAQVADIRSNLDKLKALGAESGNEKLPRLISNFRRAATDVIGDKNELSERLEAFFATPTSQALQAVQDTYVQWHNGEVAAAAQYRTYLAAYAAILLLILAWLGWRLIRSFRQLDDANDALVAANENLEGQVAERTKNLSLTLNELKSSQAQLIQSEKMASLGQMVAGVAHEINTPLGYARGNAGIVKTSLAEIGEVCSSQSNALQMLSSDNASEEDIASALTEAITKIEEVNPDELIEDLDNLLDDTDHGLVQISELVASLKDFSRVDRSRNDQFNVNSGIESSLKIAQNQIKQGIEIRKMFAELPEIECSPSQVNQIFLNIITNALHAIEATGRDDGKLFIRTELDTDYVKIRFLDNGCGMSAEVKKKIFEPFYTTKPVGQGTGLGMSIIFRIIEDHGGDIDVKSVIDKGTEFILRLPIKQSKETKESETAVVPDAA